MAWVVAGAPGAGKSTVAGALCRLLRPAPALLDKDTLFSGLVAEVLAAHDRAYAEREGAWYDAHVKVHEYAGMTAAARQIRSVGCSVVLVAPFTAEIRDAARWSSWVAELGGEPVRLIWVRSDAATLRSRLTSRERERDRGKLANFEAFIERMLPDVPPPVPHIDVDNRIGAPSLQERLRSLPARHDLRRDET
jgi:predicted kinase